MGGNEEHGKVPDDSWRRRGPRPGVRTTISDIDASVGPSPEASPPPDQFTPITDFRELGSAVGQIKERIEKLSDLPADVRSVKDDVAAMKPKLERVSEGFVDHRARIRASEARLKKAEEKVSTVAERPHACYQAEVIAELKEGEKVNRKSAADISQEVVTAKTALSGLHDDVGTLEREARTGRRWIVGVIIGVVLTVGGAAIGWIITLAIVRSDVGHLRDEQVRLRNNMDEVRMSQSKTSTRVETAATRVETAATKVSENDDDGMLISEELWCDLPAWQRNKLKQRLPSGKLPSRRCP